ncbi:MAG: GGDEF domain-containing protein [Gammaproteobacteria bacterium]|nr:GGDEF domain-containing protein [Gammaproteobacteria bacterium]
MTQLQAKLQEEIARHREVEREVLALRAALVNTRAELTGAEARTRQARYLALHDSLTSLPNRGCFREHLKHALAGVTPPRPGFAVLYLDLDEFKPINDRYGHDAGDELLRITAARLACAVRAEDMMSRLGGDEFACLLADSLNRQQLAHLACKLVDTVSAPVQIGGLALTVRPSIGIAIYPADGASPEVLLRSADTAMYHAKRLHTGYAFFERCTGADPRRTASAGRSGLRYFPGSAVSAIRPD